MMQKKWEKIEIDDSEFSDDGMQQDFSVFRTQLPRPTSTARHLLIAGITFILALIAAIFYAEQ